MFLFFILELVLRIIIRNVVKAIINKVVISKEGIYLVILKHIKKFWKTFLNSNINTYFS